MIRGAIFDLDGTLIDSMRYWDIASDDYLASLGKTPKEDLAETFRAFTLTEGAEYLIRHYDIPLSTEEVLSGIRQTIRRFYYEEIPLKPGVRRFLEKLSQKGIPFYVATATDLELADAALTRLGIRSFFSGILTCEMAGCGKEDPNFFRQAQKLLQTKKEETVVFEDSLHALQTAKRDGYPVVAVNDRHEEANRSQLITLSDYYLDDFESFESFWEVMGI